MSSGKQTDNNMDQKFGTEKLAVGMGENMKWQWAAVSKEWRVHALQARQEMPDRCYRTPQKKRFNLFADSLNTDPENRE